MFSFAQVLNIVINHSNDAGKQSSSNELCPDIFKNKLHVIIPQFFSVIINFFS
jgi:hypothetical protein